ncbi:CGNR zinc finger domain-containing protein [Paraburkholderia jirisanensis]
MRPLRAHIRHSRSHRRRWCSMALCRSRHKVAGWRSIASASTTRRRNPAASLNRHRMSLAIVGRRHAHHAHECAAQRIDA